LKEGRRIKTLPPMNVIGTYFMPDRKGASNLFSMKVDITETDNYLHKKRKENMPGMGLMHVIIAAYAQTIARYPGINRFIRGQKIFARNGIEICLTIKKDMSLDSQETIIKLPATTAATLPEVFYRLNSLIAENRIEGDKNSLDKVCRIFTYIPGIFLKLGVSLIRLADFFGLLPRAITKLSPFHASMFITNVGSLGIAPIYHHLYDFGNIPVFISMGTKYTEYILQKDGTTEKRKYIDVTLVCDERICDGHYYATAVKNLKRLIEQAWIMESPEENINEDIK